MDKFKKFKELVNTEVKKGNIVFMTVEGPAFANVDDFIKQPIEGILYDLNRDEAVVTSFIEDIKWVNDYAVCKVIRKLKEHYDKNIKQEKPESAWEMFRRLLKENYNNNLIFNQLMAIRISDYSELVAIKIMKGIEDELHG